MIEYIELTGFESHEHTIIDDLSSGINLICGESNAGKTSIVRALKLVAYNEFDPKAVRVGHSFCEIEVRTHRGTVKVKRGPKHNLWEVTKKGGKPVFYDKVGKKVVPQAAEILGMNIVKLGDVEVPVNIMDQLESHFMLAGIGSKDASGSMRAQVVDEISGLSGIEGVIKSVSLDNHRFGREVKKAEDEMEKVRGEMHNEMELKEEGLLLSKVLGLLKTHDECWELVIAGGKVIDSGKSISTDAVNLQERVDELPDIDRAKVVIKTAEAMLGDATRAVEVYENGSQAQSDVKKLKAELRVIPDRPATLDVIQEHLYEVQEAKGLINLHADAAAEVKDLNIEVASMDGDFAGYVKKAEEAQGRLVWACNAQKEAELVQEKVDDLKRRIADADEEMKTAIKERDRIVSQVKVCPLSLKPVSKECLGAAVL